MRISTTFLFSGYVPSVDRQGRPQPGPESLRPVPNLLMYTADPGRKAEPGALDAWMTDDKGMLYSVGRPGPVHYHGSKRSFIIIPSGVVLKAWAAHRDDWPDALARALVKRGAAPDTELTEIVVTKSQLAQPDRKSEDPAEKAYADRRSLGHTAHPPPSASITPVGCTQPGKYEELYRQAYRRWRGHDPRLRPRERAGVPELIGECGGDPSGSPVRSGTWATG